MKKRWITCSLLLFLSLNTGVAQDQPAPRRILLTNDNGIEDVKLIELARAFAPLAETYVVAPKDDKSGSTHYLSLSQAGKLVVEPYDLGHNITAYAVDGFPADAVVLALTGLMRETPPDVVVSGINGGPNLAHAWIGSGTIGAARMAAYFGIPAIAVSGLDDDLPDAVAAATRWVVALAHSAWVRDLEPGQYLTVSIPRLAPSQIKGIRVVKRAGLLVDVSMDQVAHPPYPSSQEVWELALEERDPSAFPESDAVRYQEGYIVIVPMRADEHDEALLGKLQRRMDQLPSWPANF